MVASLEGFTANASSISIKTDDLLITPHTDGLATLYATYVQKITFSSGFILELEGAMTILLAKEGDTWKFLNGHSSSPKPREG